MKLLPLVLLALSASVGCSKASPSSQTSTRSATLPAAPGVAATDDANEKENDEDKDKEKPKLYGTVEVGDTGYTVTLPKGFSLSRSSMDGFWDVEGAYEHVGPVPHSGPVAQIYVSFSSVSAAKEAVAFTCGKDARAASTSAMAGGGLLVTCTGKSGATSTHRVAVEVPLADGRSDDTHSLRCHYEADNPAITKVTAQVCRSLKKK